MAAIDHHESRDDLLFEHGYGGWTDRELEREFRYLTLEEVHAADHDVAFVHLSDLEEPAQPAGSAERGTT
jgi:hypothetical protein